MRRSAMLLVVAFQVACSDAASGPTGTPLSCDAPTACASGTLLGSISGDEGAATVSAEGQTADWVLVRVTEDVSDVDGRPLHVRATLTSPAGTRFALRAYGALATPDGGTPPSPTTVDCQTLAGSSTTVGRDEVLELGWGEQAGQTANGREDGRTIAFEVRHASGTCASDARWKLTVRGN